MVGPAFLGGGAVGKGPDLSLADLEAFDPGAPVRGAERRFCCPLPACSEKRRDAAHRSLAVNVGTGAWNCHRCHSRGLLLEFQTDRAQAQAEREQRNHGSGRGGRRGGDVSRARLRRALALPAAAPSVPAPVVPPVTEGSVPKTGPLPSGPASAAPATSGGTFRDRLREIVGKGTPGALRPVNGTPGGAYLERRGLPADFCHAQGVRFSPRFHGRPAVIFTVWGAGDRNRGSAPAAGPNGPAGVQGTSSGGGELVAIQGRYIDGRDNPRMRTEGERRAGVFATTGALAGIARVGLVVTEAPIDALTLALCGLPAVALCGSHGLPEWLRRRVAFGLVVAAFDADAAGDKAAADMAAELALYGVALRRLRPGGGAKDWNEQLLRLVAAAREAGEAEPDQAGRDALRDFLGESLVAMARLTQTAGATAGNVSGNDSPRDGVATAASTPCSADLFADPAAGASGHPPLPAEAYADLRDPWVGEE